MLFAMEAPKSLKYMIGFIGTVSILAPLCSFFSLFYPAWIPSLIPLLALSKNGIQIGLQWQWVTYPLIHSSSLSISLSFLFTLAGSLALIWQLSRDLLDIIGARAFWLFILGTTLGCGIAAFFCFSSGDQTLVGTAPLLLSLVVLRSHLRRFAPIWVGIWIPGKVFLTIMTLIALFLPLVSGNLPLLIANLAGMVIAYCVARAFQKGLFT